MGKLELRKSREAFARAQEVLVGGVNSPVRAYGAVGGTPPFIRKGSGSHLTDIDGNTYIDYVGSWGPLILGHAHPQVVEAVGLALADGASFGAPTEAETELADLIREYLPSMERVRLVNSGTEATMSALRLARAATGREAVVKFEGAYHGHVDSLLVAAGSGATTFGRPTSAGIPADCAGHTAVLPYNDLPAVEQFMSEHGTKVACIIVEPVAGNMGVVPPTEGFLPGLRRLCDRDGALLIFDEVMTGFRVGLHGAQGLCQVRPDLTTLGKIIGGGLPVGAYGGRTELMQNLAPLGGTYQAGTLSGNPLVTAAGIATLKLLKKKWYYSQLEKKSARLARGFLAACEKAGIAARINRVGSMMTLFFTDRPVLNLGDAKSCDTGRFTAWHGKMLNEKIYLPPSQFEALFVSTAHSDADIEQTVSAAETVLAVM